MLQRTSVSHVGFQLEASCLPVLLGGSSRRLTMLLAAFLGVLCLLPLLLYHMLTGHSAGLLGWLLAWMDGWASCFKLRAPGRQSQRTCVPANNCVRSEDKDRAEEGTRRRTKVISLKTQAVQEHKLHKGIRKLQNASCTSKTQAVQEQCPKQQN